LLYRNGEWHVVVTKRTEQVEHHKGQISFPGGACDAEDADLQATALRETFEEIGVPADAVEVLGALDDLTTVTNFVVTPFVGVICNSLSYCLSEDEVEAAIEVPLTFLWDPAHMRTEQVEHNGRIYDVLCWDYPSSLHGTITIWGATARMIKSLLDLLS
jgi:8-oxo-dGTP pyrophosphatase MutT (NUDIX family)